LLPPALTGDLIDVRAWSPGLVSRPHAGGAATAAASGQRLLALGVLAAVVVLDQTTTWWGWRHVPQAIINDSSSWFNRTAGE
jgi:hypothetical protein